MVRSGDAEAGEAEPGGGPDRKRYAITAAGTAEVEAWLAEPSAPEPHLQTELFAKVVLADALRPVPLEADLRWIDTTMARLGELAELVRAS